MAEVVDVLRSEVAATVKEAGDRGALVRGLGRSYGDAAQNGGGLVLRLQGSASDAVLDAAAGLVTVGAGASLDDLMRVIVPRGWFVPVTPGTRFVTIGGAIASDIHGKNHHVDGSFANHVEQLTLRLADGSVATVSPTNDAELFWATFGGMGLTGMVLSATIRLLRIETSRMSVDTQRVADLDALFATMSEGDEAHRYSVAWIDPARASSPQACSRGASSAAVHSPGATMPGSTNCRCGCRPTHSRTARASCCRCHRWCRVRVC